MTETRTRTKPPSWAVKATAPVARLVAGRRWFPLWAVLHHRGRKSGTAYAIPVAIVPTHSREVFLIGLPWGERTNWAQNVLAAGGATLTWKGASYAATSPRIVGADVARELARSPFDRIVGSGRFPAFIELRRG